MVLFIRPSAWQLPLGQRGDGDQCRVLSDFDPILSSWQQGIQGTDQKENPEDPTDASRLNGLSIEGLARFTRVANCVASAEYDLLLQGPEGHIPQFVLL